MTEMTDFKITRLSPEALAAQKKRNVWLALALVGFVVLVGVTTAIRIQATDFSQNEGFYFDGSLQQERSGAPSSFQKSTS